MDKDTFLSKITEIGTISDDVERRKVLSEISDEVSKVYDTIIEGRKGKFFIGRSSEMAPEIDGTILVKNADNLQKGDIVKVKITEALEYDLMGEIDDEFSK